MRIKIASVESSPKLQLKFPQTQTQHAANRQAEGVMDASVWTSLLSALGHARSQALARENGCRETPKRGQQRKRQELPRKMTTT